MLLMLSLKVIDRIGNHWSIHRDPKAYPEPEEFRPERWLHPRENEKDPWKPLDEKVLRHFTFGFGRR